MTKILITSCMLLCLMGLMIGCEDSPEVAKAKQEVETAKYRARTNAFRQLPHKAEIVEELGNNWCVFKSDILGKERFFLFRKSSGGYTGYEAITEIDYQRDVENGQSD